MGGDLEQVDLYLQGRVGKTAEDLGLRRLFVGHEVEKEYFQRSDILVKGTVFGHYEDMLVFELCSCGEIV